MFDAVLAIALLGAVLARFRAQAVEGGLGVLVDPLGGIFSAAFAGLWLMSGALFHRSATEAA